MVDKSSGMNINIVAPRAGMTIPIWDLYRPTPAEAVKLFREQLGQTLTAAQDALKTMEGPVADAIEDMRTATGQVDRILNQNPDPNSPNSVSSLNQALGFDDPTTSKEVNEARIAKLWGLNVVNGMLFPQGTSDITGLQAMFKSLEIAGTQCSIPAFEGDFLFITAKVETTANIVGSTCGDDIVEYTVTEAKIGENITIKKAAELAGIPEGEVLIRFYWFTATKTDAATMQRLKALGITSRDLTAVTMAPKDEGRVKSRVIDLSMLDQMRARGMTDDEICTLTDRPATAPLNLTPSPEEITKAVLTTINSTPGSVRSRTNETAADVTATDAENAPAPAGRAGSPKVALLATLDLARTFGVGLTADGGLLLDGEPVVLDPADPEEECIALQDILSEAIAAVQGFATAGSDIFGKINGELSTGAQQLSHGIGFSTCLGSLSLGLDISLELSLGLPFMMEVFLAAFAAALAAVVAAVAAIKAFLCVPQAIVNLLFGGICGFKPFDFTLCPGSIDLQAMVERLIQLLNLANLLVASLVSALQVTKADIAASLNAALDLKAFSLCALGASPVGISLGLI